jgi:hypothetical protein
VQCHQFEHQQLSALPPHLICARVSAGFNVSFTNAQTTPSPSSSGQCSSRCPHINRETTTTSSHCPAVASARNVSAECNIVRALSPLSAHSPPMDFTPDASQKSGAGCASNTSIAK